MDRKQFDWTRVYAVINSIPPGFWMSYTDVCDAAGLSKGSAMALGTALARAPNVSQSIHRVLRQDGTIPTGWKGEIGGAEQCREKLSLEGLTFSKFGRARLDKRFKYSIESAPASMVFE